MCVNKKYIIGNEILHTLRNYILCFAWLKTCYKSIIRPGHLNRFQSRLFMSIPYKNRYLRVCPTPSLPSPSCTLVASKSLPQQTTLPSVRSAAKAPQLARTAQTERSRALTAPLSPPQPGLPQVTT